MLINIYQVSGADRVKNHLKEYLKSYEYSNLNSWRTGMCRALIESEWFYLEWLWKL